MLQHSQTSLRWMHCEKNTSCIYPKLDTLKGYLFKRRVNKMIKNEHDAATMRSYLPIKNTIKPLQIQF